MNKTTTAERLQYLMSERDLKQIDILRAVEPYSQKYGIKFHRSDISQYVSGKVEPGQEKLKILGLALNVSPVWLMGYDVPMVQQPEEESHETMSIGQNIKRLRESHGLSQSELAQIAGVTDKAVSTWENDIKIPRMGAIQKMADYFHILKSDIIEDKKEPASPSDASETELLHLYRAVNPEGQTYILSTARMVAGNPAMQKDASSGRAI